MKKMFLSAALVILLSTAVQAQVTVEYQRERRNSNLIITYNSGGYGYGHPSGYGWGGYGGYCGAGMTYGGWGYPGAGSIYGFGSSYYSFGNGSYLYSGPYYGSGYGLYRGYGRPAASTDAAGPLVRSGPVADRMPEFASAREIEEGRRRLKLADYRGAVDQFRLAVASHTENPLAQAWFAVALAISGDGRNADKALRAAAGAGLPLDRMDLSGGLRDDREHTRLVGVLSKVVGEGSLAAAFTLSLTGDPAKLKQLAEKDPVARRLLSKP